MKVQKSPQLFRAFGLITLAALLVFQFVNVFLMKPAAAAQITARSLELVAGTTDGGSMPGGTVTHLFRFTIPSGSSVGSIAFQYCMTAADVGAATCVAPTAMDASSVTLGNETGITGMTMHAATNSPDNNYYYLSRASTYSTGGSALPVTYTVNNIVNPDFGTIPDSNTTFFVRISVYSTLDATGSPIHTGTVAASVNEQIVLDGYMPESLVFCTGETIGLTASVPDCTTATSGIIHFDKLFSPIETASATSQMAASTNAGSGYNITVNGPTLTNGSNTIAAMSTAGVSNHGVSQFGMNLVANTIELAAVGADVAPAPNDDNYRGQPLTGYEVADTYKFNTGDSVANSGNLTLGGTDAQIFTVTYIANVPGSLPAGTYDTTLTYICTPTY